jgi:ribA/ribD-fused uncharacterized protein
MKERVMYEALLAKFSQHADLKNLLVSTGNANLVHFEAGRDPYWGANNGRGLNRMGKLLMDVRARLLADEQ